jgi:hypothetical protein
VDGVRFCCCRVESRLGGSSWAVAIATIELHRPVRPGQICLHMNGMIELDRAGICETPSERRKFRMFAFKIRDAGCKIRRRVICAEISVALRAACIRRGSELHASPMLDVAGRTGGCENLIGMVNGAVVTSEARTIVCFRAKKGRAYDVARAATLG